MSNSAYECTHACVPITVDAREFMFVSGLMEEFMHNVPVFTGPSESVKEDSSAASRTARQLTFTAELLIQ